MFITLKGTVTNSVLRYTEFVNQELDGQKIIRKLVDPVTDSKIHTTDPGPTGILVNGVEILNYKSNDSIFYGLFKTLKLYLWEDYDVINFQFCKQ